MTELSVIIVHYHTPRLAAEAVSALRGELDRGDLRADCVIVDNGSDAAGADALRGLGLPVLGAGRNLGYAGGVNLGVAHTPSPFIVAMNADIIVQPGCLAALCRELRDGAAAAGPRFSWDREGRLLLPPAERRDLASEALARLSIRGPRWARLARARWRRHAQRHWLARDSVSSFALSGALLAIRRDAWNRVGPFDDKFQLYFEETDWLARLAQSGGQARYVPSARAIHRFNSSARHEPATAEWFAASARRFEDRHLRRAAGWLRWMERWPRAGEQDAQVLRTDAPAGRPPSVDLASTARWIEISPGLVGYPAAAARLDDARAQRWQLPDDVWDHLTPGRYMLRVIDEAGREREAIAFRR